MAHLVKIGNSQGIRIPKILIEQAHLAGAELALEVVDGGLLVTPNKKPRAGWKKIIENTLAMHGIETDDEWLEATLTAEDELEWYANS